MDYYINTNYDMQNEKDFFHHYNEFEFVLYFVKFLVEIFYDTLGYDALYNNVCLYEKEYYKFLLLVYLSDEI